MFYQVLIFTYIFEILNAIPGSLYWQNDLNSESKIFPTIKENEDYFLNENWFPFFFYDVYNQNNPNFYNPTNQNPSNSQQTLANYQSDGSLSNFVQLPIFNVPLKPQIFAFPVFNPYFMQKPTTNINGEVITESLVGGIPYNCLGRPSGHYQDDFFCDIFHACVHGQQQKTYLCPFVGEPQYFDQGTQKCEFLKENPFGCSKNFFYI